MNDCVQPMIAHRKGKCEPRRAQSTLMSERDAAGP